MQKSPRESVFLVLLPFSMVFTTFTKKHWFTGIGIVNFVLIPFTGNVCMCLCFFVVFVRNNCILNDLCYLLILVTAFVERRLDIRFASI